MNIKVFLNKPEIQDLIADNDLQAVYNTYDEQVAHWGRNELTAYLLDRGVDPLNHFTDSIPGWAFYGCDKLARITIPNYVLAIGKSAFNSCKNLTSITIPNSVISINEWTFHNCTSLTSVIFGANSQLTTIGDEAFYGCEKLTSIIIPDSVTAIGDRAFHGCESLTSVIIPNDMTAIGKEVFEYCFSLTSITIPDRMAAIGEKAFYNCSSLTINYMGTKEQWKNIKKHKAWRYGGSIEVIHCIDGDIKPR